MRLRLIILLFIPFVLGAQNPVRTTGRGKYVTTGRGYYQTQNVYTAPSEEEATAVTGHPITHDQLFLSHDNVQDGDYIGYVHYLCTDSIFNDRSTGSYSWSIVSGNTGSAFAVNSSTGLLTVNDYTAVTSDFTLGVEISHGTDADTAICTIVYKSGTDCKYIDGDAAGGGDGSYATPWNDFSAIDAFGEFGDGDALFIKRGTRIVETGSYGMRVTNLGDRSYIAAYGQGDKPNIEVGVDDHILFYLGQPNETPGDGDADSVTFMDLRFVGDNAFDNAMAIYSWKNNNDNWFYRLETDTVNDGNGAWHLRGNDTALNYVIYDCDFGYVDESNGSRSLKCESNGYDIENVWFKNQNNAAMLAGEYAIEFGSIKYIYFECISGQWTGPVQLRSQNIDIQWYVSKDYYYGIEFQNYDYDLDETDDPHPRDISIKNAIVEGASYGVRFNCVPSSTTDVWENITLENIFINDPVNSGIRLITSTNSMNFDNVVLLNCLVVGSGDYGVHINATENDNLSIQNCIFTGSGTTDIYSTGNLLNGILRNVIYDTKSSVTWGTEATNYDISSGDPFVGSGDYQTADGITDVIDAGTPIDQDADIIGNEITTQDIGPFEYGGTEYNWTNR